MSALIEIGLKLTNLPSDVIRKIIWIGLDSIDSMRLVSLFISS